MNIRLMISIKLLERIYRIIYRRFLRVSFLVKSSFLKERIVEFGSVRYFVSPNNSLDHLLIERDGAYHPIISLLCESLNPEGIAIDVGANAGYWSLPLAIRFSKVMAVEADKQNFDRLVMNIDLNEKLKSKVNAINCAISNRTGKSFLNIRRSLDGQARLNTGLSSIVVTDGHDQNSVEINTITIDELCKDESKPIRFVKIDVEGAESLVLEGSIGIISKDRPVFFWEAIITRENTSVVDCMNLLNEVNYKHVAINDDLHYKEIDGFADLVKLGYDIDVISIHQDEYKDLFVNHLAEKLNAAGV